MRSIFKILFHLNVAGSALLLAGCHAGGHLNNADFVASSPMSNIPTVSSPNVNPFYSHDNSLVITGMCLNETTVLLSGADHQSQTCAGSSYSFTVANNVDNVYTYVIQQQTSDGDISTPISQSWVRKSSVSLPVISTPVTAVYASAEAVLTIAGTCESGSIISLAGDGNGSALCVNSHFTLLLPKFIDGDYAIAVAQTDPAGNTASASLTWKKHAIALTPSSPLIEVGKTQLFTISGGTGSYVSTLSTNNSTGTFDATTSLYTAGPKAGVTDTLTVTDSLGAVQTVNITTIAATADHLVYATVSGDAQTANIGKSLPNPLGVQVVDLYGNPIPHFAVYFRVMSGDGIITSTSVQMSDLLGNAYVNMNMGQGYPTTTVIAGPLTGVFPDVNATGQGFLSFTETATATGKGTLGSFFPLGQSPTFAAIGDFNGDSKNDVAVINSNESTIGIMLGQGNGLFGTMTKIHGVCGNPNGIQTADLNGDGKLDLIVTCGSSATAAMQIYLGKGDGTFNAALNVNLANDESIPSGLVIADFNGDGKPDVAVAMAASGKVTVYLGNGDGTFQTPVDYVVGASPVYVIAADVDKHGLLDLIVINSGDNSFSVLKNQGAGVFGTQTVYYTGDSPLAAAAGDFNNDGYVDLAIVNSADSTVQIFANDKAGGFTEGATVAVGGGANSIVAQDFDGDGNLDFVTSNSDDSTVTVQWGLGTGLFTGGQNIPVTSSPTFVGQGLFKGDTQHDLIVIGGGDRFMQFLPGQAGRIFGYQNTVAASPTAAVAADFTGDGVLDFAVLLPTNKSIAVFKGLGTGLFTALASVTTTDANGFLYTADLRGTHVNDLIVTNPNKSSITVFLGNGDGTFQAGVDYTVGNSPVAIVAGDFNGDKYLDLVVSNGNSNTVSLLTGVGDGTFNTKVDFAVSTGPAGLVAGDFNGDHKLDLAVTAKSANSVSILLGNGNGTFQTHVDYGTSGGPANIIATDINHDGNVDLAITSQTDGVIDVLLGYGNGAFHAPLSYSAGSTPDGLVVGDFNGDGKMDLAVANKSNAAFTVLTGTTTGTFNSSTTYSTGFTVNSALFGDFNGDGAVDMLILDGLNNKTQLWIGH